MEQETRRERQRAGIAAARARGVYRGRQQGATKLPSPFTRGNTGCQLPIGSLGLSPTKHPEYTDSNFSTESLLTHAKGLR